MRSLGCTANDRSSNNTRAPNSTRNDWMETKARELARGDPPVKRRSNGDGLAFLLALLLPGLEEEFDLAEQTLAVAVPLLGTTEDE